MSTNNANLIAQKLSNEDMNYLSLNSYVSNKYKLHYIATPKVACTSLKWWFAELEGINLSLHDTRRSGETEPDLVIHEYFYRVAPTVTGLDRQALVDVLSAEDYFRFAVVRNPFKRIFSAWQSKVFLHVPMQIGTFTDADFFKREINSASDIAQSFEGFLEHLREKEWPAFLDHHWMTQAEVLRIDKIPYSEISKIEESKKLWRKIARRIEERGGQMPVMQRTNESLLPFSTTLITKRSAELIREMYEIDFQSFGYSLGLPQKQEHLDDAQIEMAIRASSMIRARHQRFAEVQSVLVQETSALEGAKSTLELTNQTLAEREAHIITLNQSVADRESDVVYLNQAVTSREGDIANLRQVLGERDEQIADLAQDVAARENNIAYMHQTLCERDEQIADLAQNVAARESDIAHMHQAVADRENRIASLSQRIQQNAEQISALMLTINDYRTSTSWAVTKPLRYVGRGVLQLFEIQRKLSAKISRRTEIVVRYVKLTYAYHVLKRCPLFNKHWYLENYPDVSQQRANPLWHYLVNGWREGRQPGPEFDGAYYRARYQDIAHLEQAPLLHYWLNGRSEGRHMNPTLDLEWLQNADVPTTGLGNHGSTGIDYENTSELARLESAIYISVIIPTYNRIKLLPGIIDSWRKVHALTQFPYEIIFSDDGSSDGSAEYLESVKDLPIKVLHNAHGGASSARNAAIRAASGERLLIIGDDIFPDTQILNVHANLAQQLGSNVAILGTVDWHDELVVNHLMHHITEIGNEQFSYNRLKSGSFIDFRHFYTCNISVDRHMLLEERAIFDERFEEYGFEDIELGYRLALRGLKIFFTAQAKGAHYHPYTLEKFCNRQVSAGRMSVVFRNIHPGVGRILGIDALTERFRKTVKSSRENALWETRVDMITSRCGQYEQLVDTLPREMTTGLRQCLSSLYSRLFRAMYEYGVLSKLGNYPNALAISMSYHFDSAWANYWKLLEQDTEQTIELNDEEGYNLAEALNTGNAADLIYGRKQQAVFDELMEIKLRDHVQHAASKRIGYLASRAVYYLFNDPRYIAQRAIRLITLVMQRQPAVRVQAASANLAQTALPGLIVEPDAPNRDETIKAFRAVFGIDTLVYERTNSGSLIPQLKNGMRGEPVNPLGAEASIYYWPVSDGLILCGDQLLSAYMAVVENGLSLAIISHSLSSEEKIAVGALRDHMLFSRDAAEAILNNTVCNIPFRGKLLRLLPAKNKIQGQRLDQLIGTPVDIDAEGFFVSRLLGANTATQYKAPYLPKRAKSKPVVFVFPIFLAVGGVERNTIEIMRQLRDKYDFVVITMERLRAEQGSLAAQALEVAYRVIEMSEIVKHSDYLRVLTRLKINFQPDLIWVCNGSPWFCDNAAAIRQIFCDLPIIDQEVYDVEQGWINRYGEAGIRSFDRFIAVNKKIEERFRNDFRIDSECIDLIYSAVDTSRIKNFKQTQPQPDILKAKYGLPKGKKIFAFVGRLTQQKRPFEFLKLAENRLAQSDEHFVLVGDGELATEAQAYIIKHELANVTRISYIENTLELHAVSEGIVFTSAYEGLPIAMIEAIAMGVPAFATDVGDIGVVLHEYGGGSVTPINSSREKIHEAFEQWLSHRADYAKELKEHEHEILKRFSSKNIAQQYVRSWEMALSKYNGKLAA